VVQHRVELKRNQVIDLGDARVDHRLGILGDRDGPFQHLRDKLLHQVLAALPRSRIPCHPAFVDDLVQQTVFYGFFDAWLRRRSFLRVTHWSPP
jgi:hypothetical protein